LKHNIKNYVASKQTAISKKYKIGDDVLANGNTGVITEVTEDVTVVLYKVRLMTDAETWFPEGDIVKVELAEYTATKKCTAEYGDDEDKYWVISWKDHDGMSHQEEFTNRQEAERYYYELEHGDALDLSIEEGVR